MDAAYFITGIGTGIGKTLVAAILAKALDADYWKPVQAGTEDVTDSALVRAYLEGTQTVVHPEVYRLQMAASPHIAARYEAKSLSVEAICQAYKNLPLHGRPLIIEGAGGLMVPLNEQQFVADLIKALAVKVILVSRNYLGSINHSLLTAMACQHLQLPVAGWVFNDQYLDYENEIVSHSGYPLLASIPRIDHVGKNEIANIAATCREQLLQQLG